MESFTLTTTANSTTFASLPFYSQPVFHARKSGILNFSCRKPRNFWVSASKDEPKLDEWDNMELKFGRMIGEDPKITLAKADMQSGEKPFFSDELSRSTPTVSMELIGKLERLDHAVKPADKQIRDETRPINPASLVNPFELENFLAKSSIKEREDDDWTRVEEVVKTGEREEVEVISTSSRGFVVSCGSLIGFLPYRNLAERWKFLAFDSWLRRKGLDPSLYRQNMGILGKYEATSMTGNSESATNSEIGSKNDVAITSDMKLELRRRCVLHFTGESRERRNMKELALQYTIPFPTTTKLGILPRKTFPHFQFSRNKVSKSTVDYSSTTIGSRRKSTTPLQVEELEDGLRISRYYVRSEDREGEEEEDEATSSSMLLSLSMKPDRNMAMLDDYEMEEMDYVSLDPNHRSGYVAVVGKPNVGKSTLSNQMVGQKLSIVTDKPQTTRHRILGICSASEYQMILYDTPGVIEKKMHKLDSMMMKNVRSAAINANCVVVVVDACRQPETIDQVLEQGVGDRTSKLPTLLVLNKKDLIKPGEIAKKIEWYEKFTDVDEVIPVSAKFGHGVDDVKEWILSKLPLGPAYYPKDISSEHPERFFVAEIVREKIFMQYRKEIPYACQVNVLSYQARPNAKDFIQVEIVVEKNSQKIILIGKEGKALKVLATAARLDIEDFLQKKVFLEIEVKVKENWRQNEGLLKYYGYGGQIQAL